MPAKNWLNGTYYSQENNQFEVMAQKKGYPHWLETCGPTAAVNCLSAMGILPEVRYPGGGLASPENALTEWMNNYENFDTMRKAWNGADPAACLPNEVPQWYPVAVWAVFGRRCYYCEGMTVDKIKVYLDAGEACQICESDPGHFVALVNYDIQSLIKWDSWLGRPGGAGGKNRPEPFDTIAKNSRGYAIVFDKYVG